ncbi:MAG: MFS transporter [Verrucomicrobia bacterium]|nr:MAG: MFS transporter [Verrucomicrobiota bacterium]TAE88756.1 MAG: MFS transporter [Verrucomicrobiota bacterium]TAF26557.1 MAG: MFS transporter [Verrucomicrobiota bacterium]
MNGEPTGSTEPSRREWAGFWSMIAQQTQNAFNDKAAQFTLIPLGGAIGFSLAGARVEDLAAVLISLPFILFAPLAGWLSDRCSKRDVLLGSALAQLIILTALFLATRWENMPLALVGFFALAVQSAFFSPAKIGINKELVGSRHLGFASGIQQMMAMLAMLAGQIAAGLLYDKRWQALGGSPDTAWQAAQLPLAVLSISSAPALLLAWYVPRVPAQGGTPLHPGLLVEHFQHLRGLWSDAPLRRASLGVAYFWGFAAYINLWSLKVATHLTGGGTGFGTLSSLYMAAASLGMIAGFAATAFLLRRRIELGWVPVGGIAMSLLALALACIDPSKPLFLALLGSLAFSSALFLAPLNAWMQDRYPPARRGEFQSAANLQDCFSGILAFAILMASASALKGFGLTPSAILRGQIAIVALASGGITCFIIRLLPSDFIRVIGLMLIRLGYRIRVSGENHLPATGGALLLPNHITWGDAFFLTAASTRPIRFIMEEGFMGKRAIRLFCQLFDTVPISSAKPREALRAAADSLKEGHLVCIFPEGQLSRTGTLRELKRGFELIARQADCPLVPAWNDGAWGSVLSFEGGRFFRKFPQRLRYGLSIAFGPPIDPREANLDRVRHGMLAASALALDARVGHPRKDRSRHANALQLGQVNALPRRGPIHLLAHDALPDALPALGIFSHLQKAKLTRCPDLSPANSNWLGGDALRDRIEASPPRDSPATFFDFSSRAHQALEHPGWLHCPCLAIDGVIVAMSMPDPPAPYPGSPTQTGRKPGALGILLPGFTAEPDADRWLVRGPSTPDGLQLPAGFGIDAESFIVPTACATGLRA